MSGPHGTLEPPAILIAWSDKDGGWIATAISAEDPIAVRGPSTSYGRHPADALQALLEKRFGIQADQDCPATLVSIEIAEVAAPNVRRIAR